MKKLNYADYMEGNINIKKEDQKTVLEYFNDNNELTYDEHGKIYNEAGIYIADLEI